MKTNKAGLAIIKEFEGTGPIKAGKCHPYLCPAGYWTLGYGSRFLCDGTEVNAKTAPIPLTEAENLLAGTLGSYESSVTKLVKVPLTENQFSALVSFVYNLGAGALQKSTLLKKLNAKDYAGAAEEFKKWNRATVKGKSVEMAGLTRRRKAEYELFLTPTIVG